MYLDVAALILGVLALGHALIVGGMKRKPWDVPFLGPLARAITGSAASVSIFVGVLSLIESESFTTERLVFQIQETVAIGFLSSTDNSLHAGYDQFKFDRNRIARIPADC